MVVIGWGGGKPCDLGPVVTWTCPECGGEESASYVTRRKSLRLYWVPVVPYEVHHLMVCEACGFIHELYANQASTAREIVDAFDRMMDEGTSVPLTLEIINLKVDLLKSLGQLPRSSTEAQA